MSWEPPVSPGFVPSGRKWDAFSVGKSKAATSELRPAQRVAEFLDLLSGKTSAVSSSSPLQALLLASPSMDLEAAFRQMDVSYQGQIRTRLGERGMVELFALSRERQWGFFLEQWLGYGRRLRDEDKLAEAALSLEQVGRWAQDPRWAGALRSEGRANVAEAEHELDILRGRGGLGRQAEFIVPRVLRETWDPWAILGFGVGGAVFQATRCMALSRLYHFRQAGFFSRSAGARFLAFGAGTLVEAPAIVATTHLGRGLSGVSQGGTAEAWKHEILSAGMTQLFLKGAGHVVRMTPGGLGRSFVPTGMLAGIYFSHWAEEAVGWRLSASGSERFTGALASLFHLLVGGSLANRAFSTTLGRWQREWNWLSRQLVPWRPFALELPSRMPQPASAGRGLVLMSNNGKNGGDPPSKPKVLPFPAGGGRPAANGIERPEKIQPLAPEELPAEFFRVIESAEMLHSRIVRRLQDVQLKLAILRNHWVLQRGWMREVDEMVQSLSPCLSELAGDLREVSVLKPDLDAMVFSTREHADKAGILERHRTSIGRFLELGPYLHLMFQKIEAEVRGSDVSDLQTRIFLLETILDRLGEEAMGGVRPTGLPSIEDLMPHRVKGMLRGPLVKQALRASPPEEYMLRSHLQTPLLSAASFWIHESEWMSELIESLRRADGSEGYRSLLHQTAQTWLLAHSGTRPEPFRAWLAVHLPVLAAANEGHLSRLMKRLEPLHPLMDEEMRGVTEWGAWWLCQALRSPGDPREWLKQFYASGVDNPVKVATYHTLERLSEGPLDAARVESLGIKGPWGAAQLAVQHFLHHPFDPDLAIHSALESPAAIREDTLSFTAALLGAFHGQGFFSYDWLEDILRGRLLYPNRDEDLPERRSRLHMIHFRLDSPVSALIKRWEGDQGQKTPGPSSIPPPDSRSANETRSGSQPVSRLRLVREEDVAAEREDWYPLFRKAFDSDSHRAAILDFSHGWARERGLPWREPDVRDFMERLQGLPAYFVQDFSFVVSFDPPAAKALLTRLDLLPENSSLRGDSEVLQALSQKASEQMEESKWRKLAGMVPVMYENFAGWFFPKQFQRLSSRDREVWIKNLSELPPIILTHVAGIPLFSPGYFLSILHRLGISSLGEPASSMPPED